MGKTKKNIEKVVNNLNIDPNQNAKKMAEEISLWIRQPVVADKLSFSKEKNTIVIPSMSRSFTLMFVRQGTIELSAEGKSTTIAAGYAAGVTANTEMRLTNVGDAYTEVEILLFSLAAIFGYGNTMLAARYGMPYLNLKKRGFEVFNATEEFGAEINKHMKGIYKYMHEKPYGYELMVKARLCEIWFMILGAMPDIIVDNGRNPRKDELRVKVGLEYIEEHYAEQITLEDIANEVNICKSECCRCFKRILEITPIEAVVRYRIYKAAFFLEDADIKKDEISSIAIRVGFNNISYFNKMFKKYIGMTPSEYKNREMKNRKGVVDGRRVL